MIAIKSRQKETEVEMVQSFFQTFDEFKIEFSLTKILWLNYTIV